ncbi:MAG: MBL fold metallo-hydrolase [Promethearchaeota archaeon]
MKDLLSVKLGMTNVYLLKSDHGYIQIDAGYKSTVGKYFEFLKRNKIDTQDIKLIIATHAHADHVGALKTIKDATNAKVLIHENDSDALINGKQADVKGVALYGKLLLKMIPKNLQFYDPVNPDIIVKKEYALNDFGINAKVIHTPGHTMGTISVIDENGNAFVGCTAQSFPIKLTPGLPASAIDIDLVLSSWKKLVQEGVKMVFVGHGRKPFSIERIKKILSKKKIEF